MPFYKHYTEQIESDVADLRNTGKNRYVDGDRRTWEKRWEGGYLELSAGAANMRIKAYHGCRERGERKIDV